MVKYYGPIRVNVEYPQCYGKNGSCRFYDYGKCKKTGETIEGNRAPESCPYRKDKWPTP